MSINASFKNCHIDLHETKDKEITSEINESFWKHWQDPDLNDTMKLTVCDKGLFVQVMWKQGYCGFKQIPRNNKFM